LKDGQGRDKEPGDFNRTENRTIPSGSGCPAEGNRFTLPAGCGRKFNGPGGNGGG
jgi:hypothetical protein